MTECFTCKSDEIIEGTTTQTYQENGHLVVIKNLPCLVCKTCGETYITTSTMQHIESFLNTVKSAEVEIVSYDTLAA
jgi:YgiT-type zinc finger domain-containing protein